MRRALKGQADSDYANVLGLRALLALRDVELDALVLIEATKAARRDGPEMDEHVGTATIRGDETETLVRVEPLHDTDSDVVQADRGS